MAGYVLSSGVPYGTYLQERAASEDLSWDPTATHRIVAAIKDSSAQLIASQEALRSQNIELLRATENGFKQLTWDVQQTTVAVKGLDATFTWGFNSVLTQAGRMADALESLLATAKTPSKTRAYEYFDDGRRAFDRGHLTEALEQVNKAICGDHTSAGYKLEWRFHLLRGAIQVGTFSHPELLDLPAAEASYLTAAKYARPEDANGAALAMLGAGWACYCQGRPDDALSRTNAATALAPSLAEGHFQASKILMALGRSAEGLRRLEIASGFDPAYVVKAAADGDFQNFTTEFDAWCSAESERSGLALQALYAKWSSAAAFWSSCTSSDVNLALLASTVSAPSPPLFDTLICRHAIESVTRDLSAGSSYSVEEMSTAIETIPEGLDIPEGLLQSLHDQVDARSLDTSYFTVAASLLKRRQEPVVAELCRRAHDSEKKSLELFALWLSVTDESSDVEHKLTRYLQQVPASDRSILIADLDLLAGAEAYSPVILETLRKGLIARYDQWTEEIAADIKQRAKATTKDPLQGMLSRAMWSMVGMTVAAVPVYLLFRSAGVAASAWAIGVAYAIADRIVTRIRMRRRRFRSLSAAESRIQRHLAAST